MRERWTDDRMDDLVVRVDNGFAQVDKRFEEMRQDNGELRREIVDLGSELRAENKELAAELRADAKSLSSELSKRFDGLQRVLIAAILAGFIGVIVNNLL